MALNLDTRQRAMLQEMGITVWWPKATAAAAAPLPVVAPTAHTAAAMPTMSAAPAVSTDTPHRADTEPNTAVAQVKTTPAATISEAPVASVATDAPTPAITPPAPVHPAEGTPPSTDWRMAPPVQAFPHASGGHADDAWLVLWECATPATPLEGDSGKLLHNMLRALRLHHSPHVWIAGMQRPGHEALPVAGIPTTPVDWQPLAPGLAQCVQHTRPARILLLGMHPARAVLGSQEALGRLRAQIHMVHHIPTVVSYDPAYLLRSPHAKPAAWADLCRAHALRPPSPQ